VAGSNLEVAVARVRPTGVQVTGRMTIANFEARPAAEWGGEFAELLKKLGASHLAATVLLPRCDVIVRQVALPGVAGADLEGAIRFQLDSLHPYGEEDVVWGWSALDRGGVLVGIARRATMERYLQLFVEAGIAVASFTFSAAAVHAAVRLNGAAGSQAAVGFLALSAAPGGTVEVYGESAARPVFSAEFDLPAERAALLAASELRLAPDVAALRFEDILPKPVANPVANDLARNALPYATALAGACPHLVPAANLLPPEFRQSASRTMLIPTAILAAALILTAASMVVYSRYADAQYLKKLDAEIAKLEPVARRSATLDREVDKVRARARLLDDFRARTRADLDAINELTRLVSPPAWTNSLDLLRDSARISGEAPQASTMLRIIDSSPLFENSEFSLISKSQNNEIFQIRTSREVRK
jgi:hypothetical protein